MAHRVNDTQRGTWRGGTQEDSPTRATAEILGPPPRAAPRPAPRAAQSGLTQYGVHEAGANVVVSERVIYSQPNTVTADVAELAAAKAEALGLRAGEWRILQREVPVELQEALEKDLGSVLPALPGGASPAPQLRACRAIELNNPVKRAGPGLDHAVYTTSAVPGYKLLIECRGALMTQVEAWEAQEEQFDSGAPRHVLHHVTDFVQAGSSGNATKVVLNAAPLDDDLLDAGVPLPVGVGGLVNYKNGRMGLKNSVRDANVELAWLLCRCGCNGDDAPHFHAVWHARKEGIAADAELLAPSSNLKEMERLEAIAAQKPVASGGDDAGAAAADGAGGSGGGRGARGAARLPRHAASVGKRRVAEQAAALDSSDEDEAPAPHAGSGAGGDDAGVHARGRQPAKKARYRAAAPPPGPRSPARSAGAEGGSQPGAPAEEASGDEGDALPPPPMAADGGGAMAVSDEDEEALPATIEAAAPPSPAHAAGAGATQAGEDGDAAVAPTAPLAGALLAPLLSPAAAAAAAAAQAAADVIRVAEAAHRDHDAAAAVLRDTAARVRVADAAVNEVEALAATAQRQALIADNAAALLVQKRARREELEAELAEARREEDEAAEEEAAARAAAQAASAAVLRAAHAAARDA